MSEGYRRADRPVVFVAAIMSVGRSVRVGRLLEFVQGDDLAQRDVHRLHAALHAENLCRLVRKTSVQPERSCLDRRSYTSSLSLGIVCLSQA